MSYSAGAPTWLSSGRLTGYSLITPCEKRHFEELLCAYPGVALVDTPELPEGMHPLCVELWAVTDGVIRFGGLDQRGLFAAAGGAFGAFVGAAWGAMLGSASGSWTAARGGAGAFLREGAAGVRNGGRAGIERGGSLGRAVGNRMVDMVSTSPFGTYHEVMIGIPNVTYAGQGPYLMVLEMLTDGPFALAAERAVGYGYRKRWARFAPSASAWRIDDPSGKTLLDVTLERGSEAQAVPTAAVPAVRWLSQPLLGHLEGTGFVVSTLERDFPADAAEFTTVTASLRGGPELATALLHGTHVAPALSEAHPWGSIGYERLASRVSRPHRLTAVDPIRH